MGYPGPGYTDIGSWNLWIVFLLYTCSFYLSGDSRPVTQQVAFRQQGEPVDEEPVAKVPQEELTFINDESPNLTVVHQEESATVPKQEFSRQDARTLQDEEPPIRMQVEAIGEDSIPSGSELVETTDKTSPLASPFENLECGAVCGCKMRLYNGHFYCAQSSKSTEPSPSEFYATTIRSFPHHICPQNFRNLADWIYAWELDKHQESFFEMDLLPIVGNGCLEEGSIVYVRGWEIEAFFEKVYPLLKVGVILVSGESILTMPPVAYRNFVDQVAMGTRKSKILHWFAQNGDLSYYLDHGRTASEIRFTPIPVGLNCKEQSSHILEAQQAWLQLRATPEDFAVDLRLAPDDPLRQFPQIPSLSATMQDKLLLLNFATDTDPTGMRERIWTSVCIDGDLWADFAACQSKALGISQYEPELTGIYVENLKYKFWLSPRGGGFDCHRTWEALYMGRIPILLSTPVDYLYDELPVVIVRDWSVITREFLEAQYAAILRKRRQGRYNFAKLQPDYWHQQILAKSKHAELALEERAPRCWYPEGELTYV